MDMQYLLGFDIGGTKCAVTTARYDGERIELLKKAVCPTDLSISPEAMIHRLIDMAEELSDCPPNAIGISCGNPLDERRGLILSPPNLPGWDNVEIVKILEAHFGVPAHLQNDANACALAEWKFGAGRGSENMIFLTFGTGFGAGLILNGRLYSGTNGNAGEVGHVRLTPMGPVGYGKTGSFEGFCSGGGLAQLGWFKALEQVQMGHYPLYFRPGMKREDITAKALAEAARAGDETALEVWRISGEQLGVGLAMLIDLLNPEVIVLGSIFARCQDLLWPHAQQVIHREALVPAVDCCRVLPAGLGEQLGDYAAAVAALFG
jgi:glucokinase